MHTVGQKKSNVKKKEIIGKIKMDLIFIYESDPAALDIEEITLTYPGFFAIIAYFLFTFGIFLIYVKSKTKVCREGYITLLYIIHHYLAGVKPNIWIFFVVKINFKIFINIKKGKFRI